MISFNLFVLPFSLGLIYLLYMIARWWYKWISALNPNDKTRFRNGLFSPRFFSAVKEVFLESLIHRKMFKRNALMGYMHMSFALGWFLLIILGNIESRIYSTTHINPPYYPIFLKFFIHDKTVLWFEIYTVPGFFRFIMDLLLLFILSGLALAIVKRSKSRWFGMTRTTHYQLTDKVALTCLWLIFPVRLFAESFTDGYYGGGGGFVTQHLGNLLVLIFQEASQHIAYMLWWTYSLVLGIFFVTLPFSRYWHIPTEILLIFFRHFGIKPQAGHSSFSDVEIGACSRCGVCIDVCQLGVAAHVHDIQAVYFIRSVRDEQVNRDITLRCLVCGRCQQSCPVGIQTDSLRLIERNIFSGSLQSDFGYLPPKTPRQASIVYFAGCMTHLTPGILRAIKGIFLQAGVNYLFLDEQGSVCCGRPMLLSGKHDQAMKLMEANRQLILATQAETLVTSCPICYRMFIEMYDLPMQVVHHSQYILELIKTGKIPLQTHYKKVAYHDPCDLGRGSHVYHAPRELLAKVSDLVHVKNEYEDALCCGGSLGLYTLNPKKRNMVTKNALDILMANQPEIIATACPLCKKTFAKLSDVEVLDIAEMVYPAIPDKTQVTA
ncbi:MAG: (Fe-S)-binding protein [Bacteroidales bacterium]|nr:(Fe-S)-binding protein [Bacteroidales bacterium]